MTDDDPVPLKAGGEAGPELVRALHALEDLQPDAARRARITQRLFAAMDQAEPTSTKLRLRLTRLMALALALAAALGWLSYQLTQ
jgi:hypothetical protein